jgi:ankyrin repeat domain-containing protein 13
MGWTPFQEAISIGNRNVMETVYRARRKELSAWFNSKGQVLLDQISNDLQDFTLEMNWSFRSIIPFVSKLCPSDSYKVTSAYVGPAS